MQNGDSGYRKVLGDSLRKHPENLFANQKKGFEMMYTGRFAYVAVYFFKSHKIKKILNLFLIFDRRNNFSIPFWMWQIKKPVIANLRFQVEILQRLVSSHHSPSTTFRNIGATQLQ